MAYIELTADDRLFLAVSFGVLSVAAFALLVVRDVLPLVAVPLSLLTGAGALVPLGVLYFLFVRRDPEENDSSDAAR